MTLLEQYNLLLAKSLPSDKWPGRTITDKGTYHCFIQNYYNEKFTPLKQTPINLLEIGIEYGYSANLWLSWFEELNLVGIDPFQQNTVDYLNSVPNCKGLNMDAYTKEALDLFEDDTFDFIIEDGPHTLDTQVYAAKYWTSKLKPGGFLIIEDIQHPDTEVDIIINEIKNVKNIQALLYDFSTTTGRRDDVILEIQKRK